MEGYIVTWEQIDHSTLTDIQKFNLAFLLGACGAIKVMEENTEEGTDL